MNRISTHVRRLTIVGLALLVVLGTGASARALPQAETSTPPFHLLPPYGPWGQVTIDGSLAPAGTEVTGKIGGVQYGKSKTVDEGWYALDAPGDDPGSTPKEGGRPGDKVELWVNAFPSCQTLAWESAASPKIDLVAHNQQDFVDLPFTDFAFCSAEQILKANITTGCYYDPATGERRYCPDKNVTRREMAIFITRALGQSECTNCEPPTFSDVPLSDPAYGWIEQFYRLNVTLGCFYDPATGERRYCPNDNVTRRQMAIFLTRARGQSECTNCTTPTFSDVPPTDPDYGWIEQFYRLNITLGCYYNPATGERRYCPNGNVTRREMAVFLARAFLTTPAPAQ